MSEVRRLLWITHNLRECDAREIFHATQLNPESLALSAATAEVGRVFEWAGDPVAACGAIKLRHGVYSAYAFGTDGFDRVVKDITRWVLGDLMPLLHLTAHRVECQSRFDHVKAHKWLAYLGARRECILRGYGSDGADYLQFVWNKGDIDVL